MRSAMACRRMNADPCSPIVFVATHDFERTLPFDPLKDALDIRARFGKAERPSSSLRAINRSFRLATVG